MVEINAGWQEGVSDIGKGLRRVTVGGRVMKRGHLERKEVREGGGVFLMPGAALKTRVKKV